jgi:hypothetical protein
MGHNFVPHQTHIPNNHVTSINVENFTQNNSFFWAKGIKKSFGIAEEYSSCQYGIFKTNRNKHVLEFLIM